jgi:hypothetical protein
MLILSDLADIRRGFGLRFDFIPDDFSRRFVDSKRRERILAAPAGEK